MDPVNGDRIADGIDPGKQILVSNYESRRSIAEVKKEKKYGKNRDELRLVL